MKRSGKVRLVLLGGLSAGALAASAEAPEYRVSPASVYLNDYHVPGAGYYHAPFRAFFAQPYNHYDAQRKQYFYGGQWGPSPHRSLINISAPTPEAAGAAEAARAAVYRGGFGSTSRSSHIWS